MNKHRVNSMEAYPMVKLYEMSPEKLIKELGFTKPPIDPNLIAKRINLDVSHDVDFQKMHYSGEIYLDGNKPKVWINPLDADNRQRFTLAHEIGHLCNDILPFIEHGKGEDHFTDGKVELRRDGRQKKCEYRANDFAARLLMPEHLVIQEAKELVDKKTASIFRSKISRVDMVDTMASRFNVSNQAMEIRLVSLGIIGR